MILGFKTKDKGKPTGFVEKIEKGIKIHTIRKGFRWGPGRIIQFATGVRTSKYHQFKDGKCISTQRIEIYPAEPMNRGEVVVDGRNLSLDEKIELAHNDGFDNLVSFWLWFDSDFEGQLIHWTDKKY